MAQIYYYYLCPIMVDTLDMKCICKLYNYYGTDMILPKCNNHYWTDEIIVYLYHNSYTVCVYISYLNVTTIMVRK